MRFDKHTCTGARVAAAVAASLAAAACGGAVAPGEKRDAVASMHAVTADEIVGVDEWSLVPVPPEGGAQLAPIQLVAEVYAKPERGPHIGQLRVGAKVARSEEPVSRRDCAGGWYAIRPAGFVCNDGRTVTTKLDHPLVRALHVEPDRSRPMPYRYAFVRSIAPRYLRVPSKKDQFQYEMHLDRHLRSYGKLSDVWDKLDVGANDVPLDEHGLAKSAIPETAVPMDMNQRFGGDGDDSVPWWLADGERLIPNISTYKAPDYAVIADRIKRHAGVALIGTFVAGEEAIGRRFAITTDARLIPADKLKADSGSPFHGEEISAGGLPVGWVWAEGATTWKYEAGALIKGEPLRKREFVELTGTVKVIRGVRMLETRAGQWVRGDDMKTAAKPSELPSWARGNTRWVDISLVSQTVVLWEGDRPVYATLTSTGRDGLGDPATTYSTPQGTFRIYRKYVTHTMDDRDRASEGQFELQDVPWVMYFKGGYALHAAYWHDDFGRPRSHGCVNLSPIDARYVFHWTSPDVPDHWHMVEVSDATESGTLVSIHK